VEPKITVIIPFFQQKPGLLTRCVESVFQQVVAAQVEVVVVDDGSPVAAREEVRGCLPGGRQVRVIEQTNAGPGAARNRGLGSLSKDTTYVALLDSDDRWEPGFLQDAVCALDQGCDVFFGNTKRYAYDESRFDWDRGQRRSIELKQHRRIDQKREIYEFSGDFFDFAIYSSDVISTSTLVYNYRDNCGLRFEPRLFNGQDRLFKLMLSKSARRVAFTPRICALEEQGVNIFDSAAWGAGKSLRLLSNYVRLGRSILDRIELSPSQTRFVRAQLARARQDFVASLLHLVWRRQPVDTGLVLSLLKEDPMTASWVVPIVVDAVIQKFRNSPDSEGPHR
jgi:succinoglycan biosynthesis protein ExoW